VIQKQSILNIVDNSGARTGLCVSTPLGFFAGVGDKILVSIQTCFGDSKIKTGSLNKAVIVCLKKNQQRGDGSSFSFQSSSMILLNQQGLPSAKRILGPVSYGLRQKKCFKVLFLASVVL